MLPRASGSAVDSTDAAMLAPVNTSRAPPETRKTSEHVTDSTQLNSSKLKHAGLSR